MQFIFNKDLESEKRLEIDYYSEQLKNKKLNGNKEWKIESQSDFPDVDGFSDSWFETLDVMDNGLRVPIVGEYNYIEALNAMYNSENKRYNINIILGYKEVGA